MRAVDEISKMQKTNSKHLWHLFDQIGRQALKTVLLGKLSTAKCSKHLQMLRRMLIDGVSRDVLYNYLYANKMVTRDGNEINFEYYRG